MMQRNETNPAIPPMENAPAPKKLTLLDFAEVFLSLPESAKREVLGYAKCLYATRATKEQTTAGA